ncbi:hypothetical protein LCGC14_1150100 [marine sediment metagenome]|uniref:Uncharacterized protein n=1 Tax=marine sediment metagenome TaxID=412755 RepID=A0A0F9Q1B2_9ZZZZ
MTSYLGSETFWEEYDAMLDWWLLMSMGHSGIVVFSARASGWRKACSCGVCDRCGSVPTSAYC